MPVKTLPFQRNNVIEFFRKTYKDNADRIMAEAAVIELVRQHEISVAKGAALLDMYVGDFVDLMTHHDLPYFTDEPRSTQTLVKQHTKLHRTKA